MEHEGVPRSAGAGVAPHVGGGTRGDRRRLPRARRGRGCAACGGTRPRRRATPDRALLEPGLLGAAVWNSTSGDRIEREETQMKVTVDLDSCDAYGECVKVCPEVFALDDEDDHVRLLLEEPGESLRE